MSLTRRGAAGVALAAAWLAAAPAQAELWGYVDARGTAHFAPRQLDSRYQLVHGERAVPTRVVGKTDSAEALLLWLEISPQVKAVTPWLREAAHDHGVDAELLTALIAVESGFDPTVVSPRGAIGLMQITATTADRYATGHERRRPAAERLRDARTNIHTGARMLADLNRRLGRIDHVLAAWNAGEEAVRRHGGLPPFEETRAHVQQVLEVYWALLQRRLGGRARDIALR